VISRVRVVRFKRFADQSFDLTGGSVLLAGPNNSGKTTLLHAISAWNLALRRWLEERGTKSRKKRVGIVLDEFTALPLREMNLLWLNRHTARKVAGKKEPKPAPVYVEVTDSEGRLVTDALTIEFLYANEKQVYVRPVQSPDTPEPIDKIPPFAQSLNIVHVPAFSGIGTQEPIHSDGIQNKLVGEGKPGEIVRNLLLEIWNKSNREKNRAPWSDLKSDIHRLFQCDLLPPEGERTYIVCEYRPKRNSGQPLARAPKLDIANAGSGFHQVLLLLAFFHGRPASVLLLDEPDAHLHFILQREIFDHLRNVAQRRSCKLIIATHAEVLLEDTEPDQIISFIGTEPRRLVEQTEKQRLQDALRILSALDLLQADHVRAVLYVEDESDHKILREWARVLDHPAAAFLQFPYVVPLRGKGNVDKAKQHFQCLRLAKPEIRGVCVLDRDSGMSGGTGGMPAGLNSCLWGRYEIENYFLVPAALKRFLRRDSDRSTFDESVIDTEFAANFPTGIDFLRDIPALRDLKGSDFIVSLLSKTFSPLPKRELYMLAEKMRPEEIHPDIVQTLDAIAAVLPSIAPAVDANLTPLDNNGVDLETEIDESGR